MFVIKPTYTLDAEKGYGKERTFNADIYALCYHWWTIEETADLFDLCQWRFWAFTQKELLTELNGSKSLSVERLEKKAKGFDDIIKLRETLVSL